MAQWDPAQIVKAFTTEVNFSSGINESLGEWHSEREGTAYVRSVGLQVT